MPLAGKGMLLTSMDIDPSDEVEFNRWYDREHLEERVAIDGFLEARRYLAHEGSPKYLCLYSVSTIDNKFKSEEERLSGAYLMHHGIQLRLRGDYDATAIKLDRAQYWISKGAQPSDTVASFLKKLSKVPAAA